MEKESKIVEEMVRGYGSKFPGLEYLWRLEPSSEAQARLISPIPALGRYYKHVAFMENVTSGRAVGVKRFGVLIEYYIALSETLTRYQGKRRKVVRRLTEKEKALLRNLCRNDSAVFRAEFLEGFTEHDTAAAGDYLKIEIATLFPALRDYIEAVHFALTSEDIMGNVFGMIGNELVFDHFVPVLLNFMRSCVQFVQNCDSVEELILPALTHEQAAGYTTLCKKFMNRLVAMDSLIRKLESFSGKLSGPVGTLADHYAAYPEIDWQEFARKFVGEMGLKYEAFTDQCVSYSNEAMIFSTIANILAQIIKFAEDFVGMASCPAQFFVKAKKAGVKGSSILPNKYNAWMIEGGVVMLRKGINNLTFLAHTLPDYPYEGNMARSFLMRDIGNDFMPIFIGLARIQEEMNRYHPSQEKIAAFMNEYPGMSGSAIQTILKREGIAGDAYRLIQNIAINSDGSYANAKQFADGLTRVLAEELWMKQGVSQAVCDDILQIVAPANLVRPSQKMASYEMIELSERIDSYGKMLAKKRKKFR